MKANPQLESLHTRRTELLQRIDSIRADFKSGLDPDSEEQAVQLENYEVLQALLTQAEAELREVEARILQLQKAQS